MWCSASVNELAELNCAVTSHLCAVSIILRINKRARHRSVNILAGQSSCAFDWLVIKNTAVSSRVLRSSRAEWIQCFVCWLCEGLLILFYHSSVRPSVRPSFRTPIGAISLYQSSKEGDGYSIGTLHLMQHGESLLCCRCRPREYPEPV
jgi:hypothetical protein